MDIDIDSSLVKEFLKNKAGPEAYDVAKALGEGVTDQEIKKETGLDINKIRSVLNRLHYLGIIEYDKEQAEKSSWYTYTWFLREDRIKELLEERYRDELQDLKKDLEMKESHVFFECEKGCDTHPFEVAYEYDFECPECGGKMDKSQKDGVEEIKERINEIEDLLGKNE